MRNAITATVAATVGLVAASTLGVASAEAPTAASPTPTVSVDGVATVPVAQGASMASATAAYRQGMAAAITDGQGKAEFLASNAGVALGAVQSIVEGDGSITCKTTEGESGYAEYEGEQPDFGSEARAVAPLEASAARPSIHRETSSHKKKKKRKAEAKPASATTCTLATDVALVYAIS